MSVQPNVQPGPPPPGRTVSARKLAIFSAAGLIVLSLVFVAGFFADINSTLTDYTWGDVSYFNQLTYNLFFGRPLQSSLAWIDGMGVVHNPYAFASQMGLHIELTAYLFLAPYVLCPNVIWLYTITIAFIFVGFAVLTFLILRHLSPRALWGKWFFAMAVFFTCGFVHTIEYKCHFALFAGPLILLGFLFMLRRQAIPFAITGLLIALIKEDMAFFVIGLAVYVIVFEEGFRKAGYWLLGLTLAYTALALGVIQPAGRHGLVTVHGADTTVRLLSVLHGHEALFPLELAPSVALPLVALPLAYILFGSPTNESCRAVWWRLAGLILGAPASHWFITLVQGAGHHVVPIQACSYAAILFYVGRSADDPQRRIPMRQALGAAAVALVGLAYFSRPAAAPMLEWLGDHLRPQTSLAAYRREQRQANLAAIAAIRAIPVDRSVCFWTNRDVSGFVSARTEIWDFPDFFDQTDYLVIERRANESWFEPQLTSGQTLREALTSKIRHSSGEKDIVITPSATASIIQQLVEVDKTHRVSLETPEVVVLERIERHPFESPPFTSGMGWLPYVGEPFHSRKPAAGEPG